MTIIKLNINIKYKVWKVKNEWENLALFILDPCPLGGLAWGSWGAWGRKEYDLESWLHYRTITNHLNRSGRATFFKFNLHSKSTLSFFPEISYLSLSHLHPSSHHSTSKVSSDQIRSDCGHTVSLNRPRFRAYYFHILFLTLLIYNRYFLYYT